MTLPPAIRSVAAERAFVFDGATWWAVRVDEHPIRVSARHPAHMLGVYRDVEEVEREAFPFERTRSDLKLLVAVERTVLFCTDLLDPRLDDLRLRAATLAEERLGDPTVTEQVKARLRSRSLPAEADVAGALRLCDGCPNVRALLERVIEAAPPLQPTLDGDVADPSADRAAGTERSRPQDQERATCPDRASG